MKIHPLKATFNEEIFKQYGIKLWGDKNPNRTEIIAQRIHVMGLSYQVFVVVALGLWDSWSVKQNHKYPYWTVITSDKSFDRIRDLMSLVDNAKDVDILDYDMFELEVIFAADYIGWLREEVPNKPHRVTHVPVDIAMSVAKYMCNLYGIEYTSSDYNDIARQLDGR